MAVPVEVNPGMKAVHVTNHAAHSRPVPGPATAANNRQLLVVPTTWTAGESTASWTDPDNITEVTITAVRATGSASSLERVLVTIDAPDDTAAANWLDSSLDSPTDEAMFTWVLPNRPTTFTLTKNIKRLDFLPIGSAADIHVEGH